MQTLINPSRLFSNELLQRYRQQGDVPADGVITAVVEAGGPTALRSLMGWLANTTDLGLGEQPEVVRAFFADFAKLPVWADPKRMARGMAFFQNHAAQIGLTLGCFSLPYCYLGANGAQVLWLTERIKNDTARRLQETGEWLFGVNNPKEWTVASSVGPGRTNLPKVGEGLSAIIRTLKVRLIHAGARWFTMHSGRWTMDWGYPINQEDMAGTNLAFSYVVVMGLRKAGVATTTQEEEDYLHHSNVIGSLNGLAEDLLPRNLREAYQLGNAISRRQFEPSEAGVGLTRSLLNAIAQQAGSRLASGTTNRSESIRNLAAGEMRFFLGDQYADWLGIPTVPVEKRLAGLVNRLPIFPTLIPAPRTEVRGN